MARASLTSKVSQTFTLRRWVVSSNKQPEVSQSRGQKETSRKQGFFFVFIALTNYLKRHRIKRQRSKKILVFEALKSTASVSL
jgi:hypothetical protein